MRFYKIEITDSQTGQPIYDSQHKPFGPWSSFKQTSPNNPTKGFSLPGALNVEFDLPFSAFTNYTSQGYLKMWGIGLSVIGESSQFNPGFGFEKPVNIKIYGGMYPGLPLATKNFNAGQTGLLVDGIIQQAFGNWEGTIQTLDFIIIGNPVSSDKIGGYGTLKNPRNIVYSCKSGESITDAAVRSLKLAFPGAIITAELSPLLISPYDTQPGFYATAGDFANYLNGVSISVVNDPTGAYQGIQITPTASGFHMFDGTNVQAGSVSFKPKEILFTDLIGQPVWKNFGQINFKTVMRADIKVGDFIKMPPGPQIKTQQSYSQYKDRATFQNIFQVQTVRHLGNFRQSSGDSWVTVFDANYMGPV